MYLIDSEVISPQPDSHEWAAREPLGFDGDGAPFYAKYSSVTLRVGLLLDGQDWQRYADGSTHTLTAPARGTRERWTTYSDVYVASFGHGEVLKARGLRNVELVFTRVEE